MLIAIVVLAAVVVVVVAVVAVIVAVVVAVPAVVDTQLVDGSELVGGGPLQDIVLRRGFCARINDPFTAPSHLHCPHYCNTIARPLRTLRPPPPEPSFVCHTPYTIDNGNIV